MIEYTTHALICSVAGMTTVIDISQFQIFSYFVQISNLERCLKVCQSLLQAALEAMTGAPPAVLEEVLATSNGQEKIKGIVFVCVCMHYAWVYP